MAGAFGYEMANHHYEVSVACGERVLLPEVRKAGEDELIVADGFSCQEQIAQQTGRTALHTAQVLQIAIRGSTALAETRPEAAMLARRKRAQQVAMARTALFLGAGAVAALIWLRLASRSSAKGLFGGVR
jgi:hypothetical protein